MNDSTVQTFHEPEYLRHNQRRQEHLATLGLDLAGKSVLEVGAGIGDHSSFFLDRGCRLLITEAREASLRLLRERFPDQRVEALDLECPRSVEGTPCDIVYCYGLLYHLGRPAAALRYMAEQCSALLLLETCVSFADNGDVNLVDEFAEHASQSVSGTGCRPARSWVFARLKALFPHVYIPATQPWHEEFPLDWTGEAPATPTGLHRAIFVAARHPLVQPNLLTGLPDRQRRC